MQTRGWMSGFIKEEEKVELANIHLISCPTPVNG
jgi:hypothetical protein